MSGKEKVEYSNLEKDKITAFVVGDPHFKYKAPLEDQEFAEKSINAARGCQPNFIVILGDTLDTHEVVKIDPHLLATEWISQLSEIAPVYLLIGNHDLQNASLFLSNKHIFNPLKKWPNVTVVDKPVYAEYGKFSFVFCPYVEPGRFVEALDTLLTDEGETWEMTDCIFAHQEFRGCRMGAVISEKGDEWDEYYPPVISGHIHEAQNMKNVFMPGSAFQHNFGESPNKKLWFVTFGEEDEDCGFSVKKIDLGMKKKKIIRLDIDEIDTFDSEILKEFQIKLVLRGTPEQFKIFRNGKTYFSLRKSGVKFAYDRISADLEEVIDSSQKTKLEDVSFLSMLKKVVLTKNSDVQEIYRDIVGLIDEPEKEEYQDETQNLKFEDSPENKSEETQVSETDQTSCEEPSPPSPDDKNTSDTNLSLDEEDDVYSREESSVKISSEEEIILSQEEFTENEDYESDEEEFYSDEEDEYYTESEEFYSSE